MSLIQQIRFKKFFRCLAALILGGSLSLHAQSGAHGVSAANINVVQNDAANTTNSVTVTATLSINDLRIRPESNRGDYNVQIGSSYSDDYLTGVLMTSVAQNGRDNGEASYPGVNYCTAAINYSRTGVNTGGYYIPVFNAPAGAEYNINVAAAFFPYTNWLGGLARNSAGTDNGANDLFTGSPGLTLGTHFIDQGNGLSTVDLTSLGIHSQTDGILLVTHGNNEDSYALSRANSNGTWTVYIKDNGAETDIYEQGPVAFVFIPRTNTAVISGRFRGDGAVLMHSGASPQFDVSYSSAGTWRLTIPGHSPGSGALILSPEGGEDYNHDNIVSYEPDGNGWLIQSRDLPGNPPGLQTPVGYPVASFVFIPAVTKANLVAPAHRSINHFKSPALQVGVSNSLPGNMTVQFYGRQAVSEPSPDFTIAVLPDTQYYVSSRNGGRPEMFHAQTEWIITNRISRNIAYVAHLGDISDQGDIKNGVANTIEWSNATNSMYRLENPTRTLLQFGIPYGVAVGNHDQEPNGDATGTTTFYNQLFGISHFQGRPYYAGHYGNNNDNHFDFFSAGGLDFIVLYFEFDSQANPDVLAWGNAVLQTNTHRRAIIVTHNFGNTATPVTFSAQGAAIYNALKANTNIFMMLAGHVTGNGSREDTYNGNTIRTFVSDYQGWTNGGNGYMRIMEFSPRNNQVVVQTYSPYTDEYYTHPTGEFFFPYAMQSQPATNPAPFTLIGTLSNVPSGSVASLVWTNRQVNTEYEWYVVVTGSGNTTTGPAWRFTTAPEAPPAVGHRLINVPGDTFAQFTLSASDANGDVVTLQTNSWPSSGVNLGFNPTSGSLTYQPAHGFRGFDQFTYSARDGASTSTVASVVLNVAAPTDTNGNGLPDAWETKYGVSNPNGDNDGDGRSNRDEYIANTNPTNALSVLRLDQPGLGEDGAITLNWPGVGGSRYRVQYSPSTPTGHFNGTFTDIVRPVSAEMGFAGKDTPVTHSFVDDFTWTNAAGTNVARYYRIKVVP